MPRTATTLLPATLTFLVEEQRVCEAEALVELMAQGNGHAVWNPALEAAWRSQLQAQVADFGQYPLFPLLYVRNSQIPRAIRAFEAACEHLHQTPLDCMSLLLEMLRQFALKRRVPLSAYATKLKRDRVALITAERFAVHRDLLFAAGNRWLADHGWPQAAVELAVSPEWIVYPIIRDWLNSAREVLRASGSLPAWWSAIEVRLAVYSDSRSEIEAALSQLADADLPDSERDSLGSRLERRLRRLIELEAKEADRRARDAEYLDSVRADWMIALEGLPVLERTPKAWQEYQDFRDRYTPIAVGAADTILPLLPREPAFTVWDVVPILPFTPVKNLKLRPLKTRIRRVNPEDTLTWACPGLEHYQMEEGISQPQVTHYVVLRLKEDAWALFNLAPPAPGTATA